MKRLLFLMMPAFGMNQEYLGSLLSRYGYGGCIPVRAQDQLWAVETFVEYQRSRLAYMCGWPVVVPLELRICLSELRDLARSERGLK